MHTGREGCVTECGRGHDNVHGRIPWCNRCRVRSRVHDQKWVQWNVRISHSLLTELTANSGGAPKTCSVVYGVTLAAITCLVGILPRWLLRWFLSREQTISQSLHQELFEAWYGISYEIAIHPLSHRTPVTMTRSLKTGWQRISWWTHIT
jgi:hypothetical protein